VLPESASSNVAQTARTSGARSGPEGCGQTNLTCGTTLGGRSASFTEAADGFDSWYGLSLSATVVLKPGQQVMVFPEVATDLYATSYFSGHLVYTW
jgi:hypothetical protein